MNLLSVKSITLIAASAGMVGCSSAEKDVQRPNILYIMSDDHAYQAISAYGHGLYNTPNIDRLAEEGAIFTRATVTNSICAPSRAVLLTGKHSFINGKVDNIQPFDWDQPNFPKLMQANGYQTAMIGKIHLDGIPKGFDYSMVLPGQGHYFNPDFLIGGETVRKEGYVTDIITDATIDWLKNQRNPDKPFCVLYHHKAPHREWEPAERHFREYTMKTFPEPANLFDDYEGRGTAAKMAEMNILEHMNWAGDSKLFPETMEELGIQQTVTSSRKVSWDISALQNNTGRYNQEQKAAWLDAYGKVNEDFKKRYPTMTKARSDEMAVPALYAGLSGYHRGC
jgi:arylsulfatase A-like enzyme